MEDAMCRFVAAVGWIAWFPALAVASSPRVAHEVLVRFEATAAREAILRELAAEKIEPLGATGVYRVRFAPTSAAAAIEQLAARPDVRYVEPNEILSTEPVAVCAIPDDPLFAQQWALHNTGQTGGTAGADIDAVLAWDLATGNDQIVVALIDTGLDFAHPDLAGQAWTNPGEIAGNQLDDDGNGYIDDVRGWDFVNGDADPTDDQGHGTLLAGSMGSAGDNATGITGVAWTLRIAPVKSLGATGSGTTAQAILAVDYATRIGADFILAGWGGGSYSQALHDVIAAADAAGIAFIAPAGGSGVDLDQSPVYPASYAVSNVVAVAATDANDALAAFSNWGPATVDLGAPGAGIVTTLRGGSYAIVSGTATAAAHVAGGMALVMDRFPHFSGLTAAAQLLVGVEIIPALVDKVRTNGRLDVYLPLTITPSDIIHGPAAIRRVWWSGGRRIGFALPVAQSVEFHLFDVRGRCVRRASQGWQLAGIHHWDWDGRDAHGRAAARGIYVLRLGARGEHTTRIVLTSGSAR
jgi:subtilisin family serine protease